MTEQQFCYWLQGFAELQATAPSAEQWQSIREHLQTVFVKETPVMPSAKEIERVLKMPLDQLPDIPLSGSVGARPISGAVC